MHVPVQPLSGLEPLPHEKPSREAVRPYPQISLRERAALTAGADAPRQPRVLQRLSSRVAFRWRTKMSANILGMLAFFVAYFWVQNHPFYIVVQLPLTALDHWIAFFPGAIVPYCSLWLYVSLPLALLAERRELRSFGWAAFATAAIGLIAFMLWPTTTPIDAAWLQQHWAISFLRGVDRVGNACPSLHVAFAVFSAVWLHRSIGQIHGDRTIKALNWVWCAAILYSTVAIRQHVVADVVAGAALGASVAAINMLWLKSRAQPPQGLQPH